MLKGKQALIVDDDPDFRQTLAGVLVNLEMFVLVAEDKESFMKLFTENKIDIALIDKNLGNEDGFDLIHQIRKDVNQPSIPVMFVSGDATAKTRFDAIEMGADDMLPKPLTIEELKYKLLALVRRSGSFQLDEQLVSVGPYKIDRRNHTITDNDTEISLTKTEYRIFKTFLLKKNEVISREWLARHSLSLKNQSPRTLDVHITSLRKKIEERSGCLKTVYGRGYLFQIES